MARSNQVVDCGIDATGNMTFAAVGHEGIATLELGRLLVSNDRFTIDAAHHGCKQKVSDAAAGKKGKDAFTAMKAVVDTLNKTGVFGTRVSISQAQVATLLEELEATKKALRELKEQHGIG